MAIWRRVMKVENYTDKHANGSKGTNILFLICGHTSARKGSYSLPMVVRCRSCEDWDGGKTVFSRTGPVSETWDKERRMPVFTYHVPVDVEQTNRSPSPHNGTGKDKDLTEDIEDLERQTIIALEKLSYIFSELADEMNRSFYAIGQAVAILNEEYNNREFHSKYGYKL